MTVKTTISLPEELFAKLEREAAESETPRSRFVAEAVAEKIKRIENERLMALYNEAYADDDTPEERAFRKASVRYYRQVLESEGE